MKRKTTIETSARLEKQPYWWSEPLDLRIEEKYQAAEGLAVLIIMGLFAFVMLLLIGVAFVVSDSRWL